MTDKGKPKARSSGKTAGKGQSRSSRGQGGDDSRRQGNIEAMKSLLLERRAALFQGMEQNLSYQSSPSSAKGDSSDLAANALDSDTAMQLAENGSSELAQIDEALRKIEESTYGQCEVCGAEIPWARLEALPYATLCVSCKEQQERMGGQGSNATGWSAVDELETLEHDI